MDFLKWLLKAFLIIALMFVGLKVTPKKADPNQDNNKSTRIIKLLN